MKDIFFYTIFFYALTYFSCAAPAHKEPLKEPAYILSSFSSFWKYWNEDVKLSEDFVSYNENDSLVGKDIFLQRLSSGTYLPLRLESKDSLNSYKLYNISDLTNDDIRRTIEMYANHYYQYFQMEGKPLAGFNFVDLNGNRYNKETCKGKIVVMNFWFINCASCVAEMPALNQLVNSYKNRDDVLFISLALDPKNDLEDFLAKTTFNYAVVPDRKLYLRDTLKIFGFPTHMIINRKSLLVKVPEDYHEMEIALRKEVLK